MTITDNWVPSVRYKGDHLLILDQQQLPHHTVYINVTSIEHVWDVISQLKVRGAPAIGITAAFGLTLWSNQETETDFYQFLVKLQKQREYLASSRPTAVNLFWALDRVVRSAENAQSVKEAKVNIEREALAIQAEDENTCRKIGEYALSLLQNGDSVMTICNAGAIATSKYGTALAPFHLAKEKGLELSVYSCETRPVLQGSRLTTWELMANNIDVTLITDNMAAHTLKTKNIKAVIVGCDRVAANGDTANKIGTYGLALQAKALGIPFYVACPLSTLDLATKNGDEIPIEERPDEEVTHLNGIRIAPEGVKVFNPAFDVTPAEYISAIITENGIIYGNYEHDLPQLKDGL